MWLLLLPVTWLIFSGAGQQEFFFTTNGALRFALAALSGFGVLMLFERCLSLLAVGTRWASRYVFTVLLLGATPVFAGWLARDAWQSVALMLWVFGIWVVLWQRNNSRLRRMVSQPVILILSGLLLLAGWRLVGPGWRSEAPWSPANWFSGGIVSVNGEEVYFIYNLPGVLLVLVHPVFFLPLLLLSPLLRRTDFMRIEHRWLMGYVLLMALLLSASERITLIDFLPVYVLMLLLVFPAFDRFFAYGFYFLKKKWMIPILAICGSIQLISILAYTWLQRH